MYWHLLHLLYWADHLRSERVGRRIVPVACTRCGCQYFYELARVGYGSATAHYRIRSARARALAERRAERNLSRRLASEAELVPCPHCYWINHELVAGFRRGQYRKLGTLASILVKVGIVFFLVFGGLAVLFDPFAALTLGIVPLGFSAAAGGALLLRTGLRAAIRPNRKHPQPPKLPPASPSALIREPSTGNLFEVRHEESPAGVDCCDFQVGRHTWPLVCALCLHPVMARNGWALMVTVTKRLTIPLCHDCSLSVRRKLRRSLWNIGLIGILATGAITVPLQLDWDEFCIITVLSLLSWCAIGFWFARRASAPAKVVGSDRSRGAVRLRFENPDYARVVSQYLNN